MKLFIWVVSYKKKTKQEAQVEPRGEMKEMVIWKVNWDEYEYDRGKCFLSSLVEIRRGLGLPDTSIFSLLKAEG